MKTEVWLTVTGEQKDPDGRADQNTGRYRACYENTDDRHIFTYEERDPDSGAVTKSEMIISKEAWTIRRSGGRSAVMRFSLGAREECLYETAFGSIPMTIATKRMGMRRIGERFLARVSYSLELGGGEPMDCAVMVKAEPVGENSPGL